MKSLLTYVAIACSLAPLSVSGTFFTGDEVGGRHAAVHGVHGWKALVDAGKVELPKEARVGRRATGDETTATGSASASATGTSTGTGTGTGTATATTATLSSTTSLAGFLSLADDGSPVTVTPVQTTDAQGKTTTVDSTPTDTPLTDTDNDPSTYQADIHCSASEYQDSGKYAPFCLPHNGSTWRVDEKGGDGFYYATWNPEVFERNETVYLSLNFVNHTDEAQAAGIWTKSVPSMVGWVDVHPKSDWLDDAPGGDTVELYFLLKGSRSGKLYTGPLITVTTKPKPPKVDTSPNNRPPVNTLGLAIGLPVVLVFIVVMVLGTHFCMKERRKVGPIHIGGVRGRKEYGTRMSRRQRTKGGAVPLSSEAGGYTDDREEYDEQRGQTGGQKGTGMGPAGGDWELTDVQGGRGARGFDSDAEEYRGEQRGRI